MTEIATFVCSICGETSADICIYCTKDTCANHRCLRCLRCSDCCECEVPLTAGEPEYEPPAPPVSQPEPVMMAEVSIEVISEPVFAEPEPVFMIEPQPEMPGLIAIVVDNPEPVPSIEHATTREELVRALPELFAPEPVRNPPPPKESLEDETPDPSIENE